MSFFVKNKIDGKNAASNSRTISRALTPGGVNVNVDMGTTRNGELTGGNLTQFNQLMTKCQQHGITVLPVLINNEWQAPNYTRDDAYYVGAILGNGFASRYGSNFHTYELGNEEDSQPAPENTYGLISWNTLYNYTAYTKKPVVATVKYEAEENQHGNEDFIYSIFLYCNERVPDPGGLEYWTNWLTANPNRQTAFNIILPQEAYGRFAEAQYKWLLDEPTMTTDLWNYWLNRMQSGTAREQAICEFCASDEF